MTIQSETHRNDYVGAGSTDTFSYGYKIFAAADLVVVERDTDDVETTLVLDTDYTVTGVGETAGGTIVLTAGNLTLDYALAIVRRRALKQETDIRNQGDFNPEQLEDAYDNVVMQTQTLQEQVDRSLLLPESLTNVSNLLPVPAASKYLRLNAAGTAFEFVALTSSVVGTIAVQDADSVAITGGAINNTSIGGVTPSPATVTTLAVDSTLAVSGAVTFGAPLPIPQGGTGQITAQTAIDALTAVSGASTSDVLTKDGSGNAAWVAPAGGGNLGDIERSLFGYASTTTISLDSAGYELGGNWRSWISQLIFTPGSGGSNASSTNLGANERHYVYLDASAIGSDTTLTASDFLNVTTAPQPYDNAKHGWYGSATGNLTTSDKCIFSFETDGSSLIVEFHHDGGDFLSLADEVVDAVGVDVDTTPLDIVLSIPAFAIQATMTFGITSIVGNYSLRWKTKGQTGTVGHTINTTANGAISATNTIVHTDSSQTIQWWSGTSSAETYTALTQGWFFPKGM